jgi:rubrerythrin
MWRSVSNAIAGMELYGDVVGFIFNMGGYIDSMYDNDKVRWHGFSDKQADELDKCYPKVVQVFRDIALDIIEMHLRCMVPYDIERSRELRESSESRGTFRNMENISWLCQDAKPTAEEVYNEFLREARKLMHYKE